MRKRSFIRDKAPMPQSAAIEYEPIPVGAKLYNLKTAAKELDELYDGGYRSLRKTHALSAVGVVNPMQLCIVAAAMALGSWECIS